MKKKWLVFIFIISICGCNENSSDEYFPTTIALTGIEMACVDSIACVYSADMIILDSILIILDNSGPAPILKYSFPDIQLKNKYGKKGRGPGEFITPSQITVNSNGVISLLDSDNGKIINYNIKNNDSNKYISEIDIETEHRPITHLFNISDDTYALANINSEYQIYIQNANGEKLDSIFKASKQLPEYSMYQMALDYDKTSNTIVGGSRFSEVLTVYNLNTKQNYQTVGFNGTPNPEANFESITEGFLKVKIVGDKIFTLFSGMTFAEIMALGDSSASAGEYIQVYDLTGKPLVKYNLDRRITAFHVNLEGNKIYGLDVNSENPLCVFDLN